MLEIDDLAKRYGPVVALDGASFQAAPGRIVGFLGPNGAGKTTTMRCIFGLARPDRGTVRWRGRPVDRAARLRFGYMPEQRGLYPRMRVGEQLSYFAQQHGLAGKTADAAAARWLDRMGLGDRAKSKLEELSHGNQQRVQLAVALAHDPELLVLDEPFSGLDPIGIATMTEVIHERAAAGVPALPPACRPGIEAARRISGNAGHIEMAIATTRPAAPSCGTSSCCARWRSCSCLPVSSSPACGSRSCGPTSIVNWA